MKKILFPILLALLFNFIEIQKIFLDCNSALFAQKQQNDQDDKIKEEKPKTNNELSQEVKELNNEVEDLNKRIEELNEKLEEKTALKIKGYFDVSMSNYENKPNIFELGNFELDVEHNYKENFQVAAALVFHNGAELYTGFIDYHLFGGPIASRGRLFVEKGLHIQVGKFDVPVGNDYEYYPAPSRLTVTKPLTTEKIMEGGYNDTGLRILANLISFNANLFMLHGIEEQYSFGGNSFGGRIGFTPFNNPFMLRSKAIPVFELGASYIYDIDREGSAAEKVLVFDLDSKIKALLLRSEYYKRDKMIGVTSSGYHVTVGLDFRDIISWPIILFSRFDSFKTEIKENPDDKEFLNRITAGINISIKNISTLKFEFNEYLKESKKSRSEEYYSKELFYIQLIITF